MPVTPPISGAPKTSPSGSSPMDNYEFIKNFGKSLLEASAKSSNPLLRSLTPGGGGLGGMGTGGGLNALLSNTVPALGSFGSMQGTYDTRVESLNNMSVDTMFMLVMGERQKGLKDMMQTQMQDYRDQTAQLKQMNEQIKQLREQSTQLGEQLSRMSAVSSILKSIPLIGSLLGAIADIAAQPVSQAKSRVDNQIEALKDKRTEVTSQQQQDMMRIQDTMQKYSQAAEQSTNVVKKYNDTVSQIISNYR